MFFIYVLKCEDDKYYVGKAMDVNVRFEQHINAYGPYWTRLYPPIKVLWKKKTNNQNLELAKTLEYMQIYGPNNVRGGPYYRVELSVNDRRKINYQLSRACFICCRYGHIARNCSCDICGRTGHHYKKCNSCYKCGESGHRYKECNNCYKCGRPGHSYKRCNNCYNCGRPGHFANECDG